VRVARRAVTMLLALTTTAAAGVAAAAPAQAASAPPVVLESVVPTAPGFAATLDRLPPATPLGAIVSFRGGSQSAQDAALLDHGLVVTHRYPSIDAVAVTGTVAGLRSVQIEPLISYLEPVRQWTRLAETAPWATNVRAAQQAVGTGPFRDASGRVLDGAGVGIAVIDSGIDATHPDLANRVARNLKIVCPAGLILVNTQTGGCGGPFAWVDLQRSDLYTGHGTHVAGIAAGDGRSSRGTYSGVAPGASLYGFSIEVGPAYAHTLDAFHYIVTNYETLTPRIRVVNNSWGDPAGTPFDPASAEARLVSQLVAKGVSVVFAAGNGDALNRGGNGADDRLSSSAKNPTPGVISAANYDDAGTGTKSGVLAASSSRGRKTFPATYPDISAPGTSITAACSQTLPDCTPPALGWAPHYATLSGTSMAAPHVAGIAAMLYQARPELTPAQVEDVLQDTARKFGDTATYEPDPQNAGGTHSFDKGAGLVDATAALTALGVRGDGQVDPRQPSVTITSPEEGTVNDGTAPLVLTGRADDGFTPPAPVPARVVVTDAANDHAGAGTAEDILRLAVQEEATGLRYTLTMADVDDFALYYSTIGVEQIVGGNQIVTYVGVDDTGALAEPSGSFGTNAVAREVTLDRAANTIGFFLPWSVLKNPTSGTPVYGTRVLAYAGVLADVAPGGAGTDADVAPQFAPAWSIRRTDQAVPPVAAVTVAIDGGAPVAVPLAGERPDRLWTTTVDTTGLADGPHSATATLTVDGKVAATDTLSFVVERPVIVVSEVAITSPADGETLPRSMVTISGTSTTNAKDTIARKVTLQLTGAGYDSGELLADGTGTWSIPFDVDTLEGGAYALTARFYLADEVVATATSGVVVPARPVLISCDGRGLSFWQNQYNGSKHRVFTSTEATMLANRGAELSKGYFTRSALVNVLYASGRLPAETLAARQYAVLLLNRAAGELSATMSARAGLSGQEGLDPKTYDTARLGTTVASATDWVRAQFDGGDLGGAASVATALSANHKLIC
jgi:serine protease AprX